jgi:hypothetical protein
MGISAVKWRCPTCNVDVGGSMGELRNHMKRVHSPRRVESETKVATAA